MFRTILSAALACSLLFTAQSVFAHGDADDYETDVEAMYVAYYGRPGDPDGVGFWAEKLEEANGDFSEIIDAFGASDEYNERFGSMANSDLVENIYQQLFGRSADDAGRDFYVGKLESGELTLATIALDVYEGRQDVDVLIVSNRLTAAHAFTDALEDGGLEYGDAEFAEGVELLAAIDETSASLTAADERLSAYFDLPESADCSNFSGSFERIQATIFDGYNCTNSACHSGDNPSGQLDLSAGNSYAELYRVDAAASLADPMQLVYPGEQAFSFLYAKLDAATNGTSLPSGGGSVMPLGGDSLSADHLEALRLWIRGGAPETGDVDNVATLLGCSVGTRPQANKIEAPEAPENGEGVQFVSGPWTVEANSENEVCFATYYDLEALPGTVPEDAKTDCVGGAFSEYDGECFAINNQILTQDPQSHHSLIYAYTGSAAVDDPSWGEWQCLNGPSEGTSCDPLQIGVPVADGGADCGGEHYVCGTPAQRSIACTGWGPTDHRYRRVGMGGSQTPVSENDYYEGVYNILPSKGVIIWNSHAFNLSSEDTTVEQYNNFSFATSEDRVYRARGIFDTKDIFVADVPPYERRTYCSHYTVPVGTRLTELSSHAHQRGVLWQTWLPPQDPDCVVDSCVPNDTPAEYVSRIYNDPLVMKFDPPLEYDDADESSRTMKFCLTYDNGSDEYPDLLKRNSTSVGTTCVGQAYCVGGDNPGTYCGSDDAVCGGDGVCDACTVTGGYTTEDEMFLFQGNFYIQP